MVLELEQFTARISLTRDNRMRLTLEYPGEPAYRDRVMQVLADLIRPTPINDPLRWGTGYTQILEGV